MKRSLIAIFFLCFIALNAQDSLNRTKIGVDFSMGNNAIGRANMYPSITLSNNKHVVFAGPSFIYGIYYNTYAPAYGAQAGYQFFPNGKKNTFNLFFEYDMNWLKKEYKFNYYSPFQGSLIKRAVNITSFDNYLGFGFHINLSRAFYLHTNVGLGMIIYKEDMSDEYSSGLIHNTSYSGAHIWKFYPNQYQYGGWDDIAYYPNPARLIGIFKVGLGINVHSFKKKSKEQK